MISTNNPQPQCNFWEELQTKVAQIENRHKQRTKQASLSIGQRSIKKKKMGRFQLEEAWHRHAHENTTIKNRIHYLQQQKSRKERTLELTRRKFQRVMEIRTKSMREKEQARQMRTLVIQDLAKEAKGKAQRIRQERAMTSRSVRRVREENGRQAKEIRQQIELQEKVVATQRQLEKEIRKQIVESAHERDQESKLRLSKMQQDRIERGRENHKEYLKQQLQKNMFQQRRNCLLRQKLEASLSHAGQNDDLTTSNLREMQSGMMPTPPTKKLRLFSSH